MMTVRVAADARLSPAPEVRRLRPADDDPELSAAVLGKLSDRAWEGKRAAFSL